VLLRIILLLLRVLLRVLLIIILLLLLVILGLILLVDIIILIEVPKNLRKAFKVFHEFLRVYTGLLLWLALVVNIDVIVHRILLEIYIRIAPIIWVRWRCLP